MSKIAIVTDTNSGITQEEAKKLGVHLLAMPFIVDDKEYFEGVSCSYEHFFEMLDAGSAVSTSQPDPDSITSLWDELLKTNDYIIHIPMSSALSGACGTAKALAYDYNGKICVVDNKRISISQRQSVIDAKNLVEQGLSATEIVARLEETAYNSSIYLAVNTLELLKKSGRVTAAGAAVASILGIKPVLQIQGEKLDAYAKARGMANAQNVMITAVEKDLKERFAGRNIRIDLAYSGDIAPANDWKKMVRKHFGDKTIQMYRLPVSISSHVGAGVCAIGIIEII